MVSTFEVPTDGFAKELVERTAQTICMQSHRKRFEVTRKEKLRDALQKTWFRSGKDRAIRAADSGKSHSHMYLEFKHLFNDSDFAQSPERQPTQEEVYDALPAEIKAMAGPYLHKPWEDMSMAVRVEGPDNVENWNGDRVDNLFKITITWHGAVEQQLKEWEGTPQWDKAVATAMQREREEKRKSWERMREWHKSCHRDVDWGRRDPWEPSTPTEEDMITDANAQVDAAEDRVSEDGDDEGYNRVDELPSHCEGYEIIFKIDPCHLHPKGVSKVYAEVVKGNNLDGITVNGVDPNDEQFTDQIDRKDVVGWKRPRPNSPDPEDIRAFNASW